jgi:hypothetical protein
LRVQRYWSSRRIQTSDDLAPGSLEVITRRAMRTWYKISQTADDVRSGKTDELYNMFTNLQKKGTLMEGAAIYGTDDAGPDPFSLFVSPVGASISLEIVKRLGGVPCPDPKSSDIDQFVGAALKTDFAKE